MQAGHEGDQVEGLGGRLEVLEACLLDAGVVDALESPSGPPHRGRVGVDPGDAARHRGQARGQQAVAAPDVEHIPAVPRGDPDQPGVVGGVVVPVLTGIRVVMHRRPVCPAGQQRSTPLDMRRGPRTAGRRLPVSTARTAWHARDVSGPTATRRTEPGEIREVRVATI
ncbi:hypothetical protein MAV101_26430 [Mycobacterium avium subsp. hominissuis 101]|nr:hypothetical protein MAV101_26430 [Mycobacterium avium subsp. hominissuis 101]